MPVLYNKLILNAASKCQAPHNPTRVAIRRLVIHNRLPEGLDSICFYYPWKHGMRMWKCKREQVWEQELNRHAAFQKRSVFIQGRVGLSGCWSHPFIFPFISLQTRKSKGVANLIFKLKYSWARGCEIKKESTFLIEMLTINILSCKKVTYIAVYSMVSVFK